MKKIEIIIPHYNGSHHIAGLLNSIPNLSWIKVTIVDDHSTVQHLKELKNIIVKFNNVDLLRVPKGEKGPGIARNMGVSRSKADWILFADVDDFFVDGAFKIIDTFRKGSDDIVFFPPTSIVKDSNESPTRHKHYLSLFDKHSKIGDKKVFYKFYAPWSKLISRNLINKYRIEFDDGVGGEDNIFSLKTAFYAQKYSVCANTIYCVTESKESLTACYSNQVLINHFNAMSRYNDFLEEHCEAEYQAWMLGWVLRGRQISINNAFNWLMICLKKGYPLNPLKFFF